MAVSFHAVHEEMTLEGVVAPRAIPPTTTYVCRCCGLDLVPNRVDGACPSTCVDYFAVKSIVTGEPMPTVVCHCNG